ncbi:MAG: RNase adapter RapZ, partial [Oscillospiraceae bacterium]
FDMDFLLVTGLSGAGKSQAAHALEDIGYFCIDNIPSELIERLVGICRQNDENGRYAAVIDIRSHSLMGSLFETRDLLVHLGC